jgi:hypothetical protein
VFVAATDKKARRKIKNINFHIRPAKMTRMTANMNMKGFYTGHATTDRDPMAEKNLCVLLIERDTRGRHTVQPVPFRGKSVQKEYDNESFAERLSKSKLGDLIDWEEAEALGLIRPLDFLTGI